MRPFAVSLKMIIGRKKSPAAVHVRAVVAWRVLFIDLRTWTVVAPFFWRVFERWYENQRGSDPC